MSENSERPPAVEIMRTLGLEPDPWQIDVLEGDHPRLLLNCCRQAGKSTVVAMLGLVQAMFVPGTKVLLVSRSFRQSSELFRIVLDFHRRLGSPFLERRTGEELVLTTGGRIVCVPCREETIRGFSSVTLLVIDEAARVPDNLYRTVRPMLAVSSGRLICLSTPYGKRGFFHETWAQGGDDWKRIEVRAECVARITPEFLEQERRALGESWFRQEYCCSFEALEGLVYPDFARCVVAGPAPAGGRRVGGIDFGFRNPFAALWGTLDRDGVLWLTGEHYARQRPLSYHAAHLPRDVFWYADPSGALEINELRAANFKVRAGDNSIRPGIAALSARLENGTLRLIAGACPNLLAEAELYRYSDDPYECRQEMPVDDHNHALAALRYLVSSVDAHRMARPQRMGSGQSAAGSQPEAGECVPPRPTAYKWLSLFNEELWTRVL